MKTILIADDDQDVLIGLERALEDAGFSTTTAWGREEALRLSEGTRFDLLLIDEGLCVLNFPILMGEFRRSQPKAVLLLMHARRSPSAESDLPTASACKWEHDEVKARVRRCLAA
jgi:DNA-binding response OmpR family regulator